MGIPMVKCAICGKETTKRQTLLIEPYGRICRGHPEVEAHKAKMEEMLQQARDKKASQEAMEGIKVLFLTEQARVLARHMGWGLGDAVVYLAVTQKLPKELTKKIAERVAELGPLTDQEVVDSVMMMAHLNEGCK
jgi:hypothetical protein